MNGKLIYGIDYVFIVIMLVTSLMSSTVDSKPASGSIGPLYLVLITFYYFILFCIIFLAKKTINDNMNELITVI